MKVTLESTTKLVTLIVDGKAVPARIWQGHTANGIECHAFITRIAVDKEKDAAEFEKCALGFRRPDGIGCFTLEFRMGPRRL